MVNPNNESNRATANKQHFDDTPNKLSKFTIKEHIENSLIILCITSNFVTHK